jgi:hypothetical protein
VPGGVYQDRLWSTDSVPSFPDPTSGSFGLNRIPACLLSVQSHSADLSDPGFTHGIGSSPSAARTNTSSLATYCASISSRNSGVGIGTRNSPCLSNSVCPPWRLSRRRKARSVSGPTSTAQMARIETLACYTRSSFSSGWAKEATRAKPSNSGDSSLRWRRDCGQERHLGRGQELSHSPAVARRLRLYRAGPRL